MAVKASDFIALNDGVLTVYAVDNDAETGDRPKDGLVQKYKLRYRRYTVGLERYYSALQNNVRISRAVVVPLRADVNPQDIVVMDGARYLIEQVQHRPDTMPATMLLSLSDIAEVYEL